MSVGPGRRVALVTGANRGIGLEVCRQLGALGLSVVLTARDAAKGEAAAAGLREGGLDVQARQLDVTDQAGVDRLASELDRDLGRLDALVNNAGVGGSWSDSVLDVDLDLARRTLETNFYGPWRVTRALAGLLRRDGGGRIVNVSSGMGQLAEMGPRAPAYRFSKTALNALTRVLAAELRDDGVLVNAVCPGWVRTDMGGSGARRSVEEGADTPVWLATLPDDGPTGGFFRDRSPIPW